MIRKFITFAGYTLSFGLAINLFYIFIISYLNNYKSIILINKYGEAQIELILFPITLIFCLIGLYFTYKDLKKTK